MLAEMYSFMVNDGHMTGDGSNIVSYIEMYIFKQAFVLISLGKKVFLKY